MQFDTMILRSSVRGTISQVADSVSLGRGSNGDPDRYRANSIYNIDNNNNNRDLNNNNNIIHNSNNNFNQEMDLGDGTFCRIFRCKSKRCLLKHKFIPQDKFFSTVTNRVYDCIVPPGTVYINEHSSNVIYLITCDRCWLQYVGETCQKLNERFNWHNSCFRYPKKYLHCKILNAHFSERFL